MGILKEEKGNRYGRLLVRDQQKSIGNKAAWLCICDCGNELTVTGDSLRQGKQKSCGCYRSVAHFDKVSYHGHSNAGGIKRESRTYKSWQEMWRRCTKPAHISYKNYGAKGVRIDPEWESFKVFLADMGERPQGLSLDRKDNNLGYCKDNCRWATRLEQNQNRSQCHFITINGLTHVLAEWCRRLGVGYNKAYKAIVVMGKDPLDVFGLRESP